MSKAMRMLGNSDVVVRGGGVIGLSVALELRRRGARVQVIEVPHKGSASLAAAGMLAAEDPHNPTEILDLATMSADMYPKFIERLESLSGLRVPFQTETTMQYLRDARVIKLAERSIDPRMLMQALKAAVVGEGVPVGADVSFGDALVVHTSGAWLGKRLVRPVKGQMMRVRLPEGFNMGEVHRSDRVYVVPRSAGPQAGTALVGATVEETGFDVETHPEDLLRLRAWAEEIVPGVRDAELVESWAGLRPGTEDGLPVMGAFGQREFVASGHFRNGILLAPATAVVMADLIEGKLPGVRMDAFAVGRFG